MRALLVILAGDQSLADQARRGYEGGELEFPKVGFTYKGKTGDGIFFASMREGKPDPKSLHGARPVTNGEKFILSQWIHDRPFKA